MAAKAVREFDGKHLLAHWLLSSPSLSTEVEQTSHFAPPTTKLAQVQVQSSVSTATDEQDLAVGVD
ncbi:hypothetical protein BJ085DRAFT_39135, partial [Dimargaris cristalligena]